MPSPTRETRIEIEASESLQSLPGKDGVAYVPSIPAGQIVTLPGSIKVLIREPDMFVHGGQPYKMATTIALKATMPGLNRRLDNFDFQKSFEIRYPLELQKIDYLHSVAQGSENKISMQIHNQSNKIFGVGRNTPRRAEVKISIASEVGSLRSASGVWSPEVFQETEKVPARSTIDMSQVFKISHRAKDHAYTTVHVQFFISSPGPAPASGRSLGDLGIPTRLTQSFDLKIQISAAHIYDEEAGILVVTNVKTPPERFEAIGEFIRKELRLKMDVWNVSQYGGLIQQDQNEEEDENAINVLEQYRGRTIILLGNKFEHFGLREQTMINLCESEIIGSECFAGSSCLLLGSEAEKSKKDACRYWGRKPLPFSELGSSRKTMFHFSWIILHTMFYFSRKFCIEQSLTHCLRVEAFSISSHSQSFGHFNSSHRVCDLQDQSRSLTINFRAKGLRHADFAGI